MRTEATAVVGSMITTYAELDALPDRVIVYEPRRDLAWMKDVRERWHWWATGGSSALPASSIVLPVRLLHAPASKTDHSIRLSIDDQGLIWSNFTCHLPDGSPCHMSCDDCDCLTAGRCVSPGGHNPDEELAEPICFICWQLNESDWIATYARPETIAWYGTELRSGPVEVVWSDTMRGWTWRYPGA